MTTKKSYTAAEKAKIALEAAKGQSTINEITQRFGVHSTQILRWKKQLLEKLPELFSDTQKRKDTEHQKLVEQLYQQIGQLSVERDFLKKKLNCSIEEKRNMINQQHPELTVSRQCELLELPRASYYYEKKPMSDYNRYLSTLIDEEFARHPFLGTRRMREYLISLGHKVNRKRVINLYQELDLEAVFPKKNLSKANPEHKKYPYLLRNVPITHINHVWSTDITYLRLPSGFVYLMTIIDWYSRYILGWAISTTLEAQFCIEAVALALQHNGTDIFNVDQGAQFTCQDFVNLLLKAGIKISMDGKGRALDNIYIERFWRSIKHEWIYLHSVTTVNEMIRIVKEYMHYYNFQRPHQSLNYQTPAQVYEHNGGIIVPDNTIILN
ncbi:IS3 family transposase [Solemya velum gill symbiont]|uniref:IS3 family transposase n=1 Tax=Solemya velum gill symbiont TaxID=2340 RepID=UPI00398F90B1